MNTLSRRPGLARPARGLMLLIVVCGALAAPAAPAAVVTPPQPFVSRPAADAAPSVSQSWSFRRLLNPITNGINSRARMIQIGTVAMAVALYIIWWRRT